MIKKTPIEAFVEHAHNSPEKVFLYQPMADKLVTVTYAEALAQVNSLAKWLDRYPEHSHIGILSLNCMHWFITDLAIMLAGHVSVPIYPTASMASINQILEHGDCKCLFLGKMPPENNSLRLLDSSVEVVSMFTPREEYIDWNELVSNEVAEQEYQFPDFEQLATIVYTSGTTGMPKGVMMDYQVLANAGEILMDWIKIDSNDRFFSYLPLAHVAERTAIEMASIYSGADVSFTGSLETFSDDLARARPTVFFGVPRIWVKFQQAVESKIPPAVLRTLLATPILGKALAKKLRQKLGLGEVKIAVSGAAALPKKTMQWYDRIGIPICEAYGMSESMGTATFNHPDFRQVGSVGKPLPGTELQLMENDEIAYRNNCLMGGYYKEPELSHQTIRDGWLYTGDTGRIDEDGFVWITGRLKDIFKTEKGKYIAPLPIESELLPRSGFEQLCVMGTNMTQPVIVAPVPERPAGEELKALHERLERVMNEVNTHLPANEKLSHWFLVEEDWTTENAMITPTLKPRRQSIENRYAEAIHEAVENPQLVQWLDKNKLSVS
jgi:long-chain acyl-CoA synthetase